MLESAKGQGIGHHQAIGGKHFSFMVVGEFPKQVIGQYHCGARQLHRVLLA